MAPLMNLNLENIWIFFFCVCALKGRLTSLVLDTDLVSCFMNTIFLVRVLFITQGSCTLKVDMGLFVLFFSSVLQNITLNIKIVLLSDT